MVCPLNISNKAYKGLEVYKMNHEIILFEYFREYVKDHLTPSKYNFSKFYTF